MRVLPEGLGWVGSWLTPEAGPHSRHDWTLPRLSGLTAPQTVDDPRTPPRRWWEGDTAVPVCVCRARPGLGGGGGGAGLHHKTAKTCETDNARNTSACGVIVKDKLIGHRTYSRPLCATSHCRATPL